MRCYVVPGRVELVGKHVDYAGGRSLTCAVDVAITACARPLREAVLHVQNTGRQGQVTVRMHADALRTPGTPIWSSYIVAVARRFARDFPHATTGVEVDLRSTLPAAAGLSSSSALTVAIGSALVDANDMESDATWRAVVPDAIARAEYFAAMETGSSFAHFPGDDGVGVRGGAQDHVAIVCAMAGSVGQFSYLPAHLERRVPWPADYQLAIGVSGVTAAKTGNARARYNRASDAIRALLRAWNTASARADGTLADAIASSPDAGERLVHVAKSGTAEFSAEQLVARLAQFREEVDEIVPRVADALHDRDLATLGRLVDRSQEMAECVLGNQVRETIFLARAAREFGAVAASAFGAGFGGAVWAMIPTRDAAAFLEQWRVRYEETFPHRAAQSRWMLTMPSEPAREIVVS